MFNNTLVVLVNTFKCRYEIEKTCFLAFLSTHSMIPLFVMSHRIIEKQESSKVKLCFLPPCFFFRNEKKSHQEHSDGFNVHLMAGAEVVSVRSEQ